MDAICHLSKVFITFFDHIMFKRYLQPVIWGFGVLWGQKKYKDRRILMKQIANLRKMSTSFRRKKHQEERASEASVFYSTVSICVQIIWKQYRPLETILCFSRWSRKRPPTASQKQKQIGLKTFFSEPISSTRDF